MFKCLTLGVCTAYALATREVIFIYEQVVAKNATLLLLKFDEGLKMNLQELGTVIDIDIKGSLERFSNFEPMYIKYLKRFLTEPTYAALKEAIAAQDFKGIETQAHTLKGICGNLGFTTLFDMFNKVVQAVRAGDNDLALKLCAQAEPEVQKVCDAIAQLD